MFDLSAGGRASREAAAAAHRNVIRGLRCLILSFAMVLAACASAPPSPPSPTATPTTIPLSATATVARAATPSPTRVVPVELRTVTDIIDGDSFWASEGPRTWGIDVLGIDAPEAGDQRQPPQCFGREAAAKAKEMLLGKQVKVTADPSEGEWNTSARLRYVELPDGTDFGLWMIRNGYAHEHGEATPYQRQAEYKAAYAEAKAKAVGFWSPSTCNGVTTQLTATPTALRTPGPARPTTAPATTPSPTAKPRT